MIKRISHGLWFDMMIIQLVVSFLSPSLGKVFFIPLSISCREWNAMEYLYITTDRSFVSCVMDSRGAIIVNCVWVSYICIRDGIFMSQNRDARWKESTKPPDL